MLKPRLAALLLLANPPRMLDSMLALLKPNQAESRVFTFMLPGNWVRRSAASWVRATYCETFCALASLVR